MHLVREEEEVEEEKEEGERGVWVILSGFVRIHKYELYGV